MRFWKSDLTPFAYLNITQFLGALNDNLYKFFLVYLLIDDLGAAETNTIVSIASVLFVIPFLLFSASSGILADQYSKSRITVWTKILEVVIAGFGVVAFYTRSAWASYTVLFLLGSQSALFGPSKYGIVPELVPTEQLSKANGMVTSFTYAAIIIGTGFSSLFTDLSGHRYTICAFICLVVALVGLWSSLQIPFTPPSGSDKKVSPHFIKDIKTALFEARETPFLSTAILGSAFFLFAAAWVQMNVIPFAMQSLGLSSVDGGYLFMLTTIGIGVGAVLAGRISGREVQLGLSVLGAAGITFTVVGLAIFGTSLIATCILLFLVGVFAGLYQIPLDSYIQYSAHPQRRGQAVAATNFLSFLGVAVASVFFYLLGNTLELTPTQVFLVLALLCAVVAYRIGRAVPDRMLHTISRAGYMPLVHVQQSAEQISLLSQEPRLIVMKGCHWKDFLLLSGFQQNYRFYVPREAMCWKWLPSVVRRLGIQLYDSDELNSIQSPLATDLLERVAAGQPICLLLPGERRCPMLEQMLPSAFPILLLRITHPARRVVDLEFRSL
jgi:acyl-[acyl-carrier-protein]-phospholipid O-acyltransferase/long-chain-fatty-acid--[acyl-carrier-protein] ligase